MAVYCILIVLVWHRNLCDERKIFTGCLCGPGFWWDAERTLHEDVKIPGQVAALLTAPSPLLSMKGSNNL